MGSLRGTPITFATHTNLINIEDIYADNPKLAVSSPHVQGCTQHQTMLHASLRIPGSRSFSFSHTLCFPVVRHNDVGDFLVYS
jgi:hypothetical protein